MNVWGGLKHPCLRILSLQAANDTALAHSLEHQYRGRDRDIQRVKLSKHGDADMCVSSFPPYLGQPCRLCTEDDGCRSPHIRVIIERGVLELGCEYLYAVGFQE